MVVDNKVYRVKDIWSERRGDHINCGSKTKTREAYKPWEETF